MADIISADYFIVNGVSSATVGLFVDTPPVPPMAAQRYTEWATGVDMDNSSPDDVYENIQITLSCYMFFKSVNFSLAEVYAFLAPAKTLQLSRFADRYLKVRQVQSVSPSSQYDGNKIKLQIGFVCAPFKYHTENDEIAVNSDVITNPGTRYSRPVYKIAHSGACSMKINGDELQIAAAAPSPIFIDAARMFAYDAIGQNATKYTTGNFPFLQPGSNAFEATNCTVTVTGNWRDY
jgi:phage-related protein